jgi:hypothetical protein
LTEEQWERLRAWLQQTEVQQFQVGLHLLTHLKAQYVRAAKSPIVASDTAVQLLIHAAVVLRRQLEAQGIQSVLTVSSRRITLALTEGLRIPATLVVFGAEIPCVECLTGDREKPDCTLPLDENTWRHIMDFFSTLRDQGAPVLLPTAENVANLFRS